MTERSTVPRGVGLLTIGALSRSSAQRAPTLARGALSGTSYRVVKAALHKLVAEIELATPASVRGPRNLELAQKPALLDRIETTHP